MKGGWSFWGVYDGCCHLHKWVSIEVNQKVNKMWVWSHLLPCLTTIKTTTTTTNLFNEFSQRNIIYFIRTSKVTTGFSLRLFPALSLATPLLLSFGKIGELLIHPTEHAPWPLLCTFCSLYTSLSPPRRSWSAEIFFPGSTYSQSFVSLPSLLLITLYCND